MAGKLTEAELLACTVQEVAHLNGGREWFGYIHRCVQHPRLTRLDKYVRKTRGVASTWRVDLKPVADLAEAAKILSTPYAPSADEIALLAEVPDEYTLFEMWVRFVPLAEVGLVEFSNGECRRTDAGRAALATKEGE